MFTTEEMLRRETARADKAEAALAESRAAFVPALHFARADAKALAEALEDALDTVADCHDCIALNVGEEKYRAALAAHKEATG
jgi:hypothetical protein